AGGGGWLVSGANGHGHTGWSSGASEVDGDGGWTDAAIQGDVDARLASRVRHAPEADQVIGQAARSKHAATGLRKLGWHDYPTARHGGHRQGPPLPLSPPPILAAAPRPAAVSPTPAGPRAR